MWPWHFMDDLEKTIGCLFCGTSSCVHHFYPSVNSNSSYSPKTSNSGPNQRFFFFVPCDLEICQMTFKNNRVPLLCYFKLCASFHNHRCIQTRGTDRKRPIWVKIGIFLPRVTLKFDGWHWKSIGHLLYATSNFVHHFITISEFKL